MGTVRRHQHGKRGPQALPPPPAAMNMNMSASTPPLPTCCHKDSNLCLKLVGCQALASGRVNNLQQVRCDRDTHNNSNSNSTHTKCTMQGQQTRTACKASRLVPGQQTCCMLTPLPSVAASGVKFTPNSSEAHRPTLPSYNLPNTQPPLKPKTHLRWCAQEVGP